MVWYVAEVKRQVMKPAKKKPKKKVSVLVAVGTKWWRRWFAFVEGDRCGATRRRDRTSNEGRRCVYMFTDSLWRYVREWKERRRELLAGR
jgi:hypothetical protein